MDALGAWATTNPVCFTVLAFPTVLGVLYIKYKVIKAILTDTW
jgi:hypothetical protein